MDTVITTMIATCDRLLMLLTGRTATSNATEQEAALEAIELLGRVESFLLTSASAGLPPLEDAALETLKHRTKVLEHVSDVLTVLKQQGLLA